MKAVLFVSIGDKIVYTGGIYTVVHRSGHKSNSILNQDFWITLHFHNGFSIELRWFEKVKIFKG
jgi:hypothetical protein